MTARSHDITIRTATASDMPALRRLALMDDRHLPDGDLVVAEVAGEIRAAVSLEDGSAIADPWRRTADLVELLRVSATPEADRRGRALRPAPAW